MSNLDYKSIQAEKDAMFARECQMGKISESTENHVTIWTDEVRVNLALEMINQEMLKTVEQENTMSLTELRSEPMKSVRLRAYADGLAAAMSYFSIVERRPRSFRVQNALKVLIEEQQDLINSSITESEDPKELYEYKKYLESLLGNG